jgi:DNA-binding CsgD family transcriptional regulator
MMHRTPPAWHGTYADVAAAVAEAQRNPDNWNAALSKMAAFLRCTAVRLVLWEPNGQHIRFTSFSDAEAGGGNDPALDRPIMRQPAAPTGEHIDPTFPTSGPQSMEVDRSLSEGGRSYEVWLSRQWLPTLLSIRRSADNSPFSPEDIATIHSFVPHLRLALNLRQSQTTQELALELIGRCLDRLGQSLIIVDGRCCVLYWTRGAAKRLGAVWSADYFTGLSVQDPIEGGKIQAAVTESILRGTTSKLHLTKIASHPLEATVFPLSHFDLAATSQVRFAAILVGYTLVKPQIDKRNLMNLYNLTAAEAKLATDLLLGKRVIEIARDRSVSIATVRAQVRAVLAKTETHRQLDLVRLLSQIASDGMPIGSSL